MTLEKAYELNEDDLSGLIIKNKFNTGNNRI